jgi:hypothetical protein
MTASNTSFHAFFGLGVGLLLALPLGCKQQDQADIPNRVLDRPTDVALVCAVRECTSASDTGTETGEASETCVTVPLPLNLCETEASSCSSDNPHLIGFVANSERNEIAMFTKCSNRLVDMDVESPGYDFIPAGQLPTDLDASADGCRVVSANVGSCDLSVLDAPGLAGFGLGDNEDLGESEVDEPSSLVSNVVPRTYDETEDAEENTIGYRPLGARPGQLVVVPDSLTQAPNPAPGTVLDGPCDPQVARSAYVSFPTCNLVAEIDLRTGHILQSRQFESDGVGGIIVLDTGISPSCPIECSVQFDVLDEILLSGIPPIDEDSAFVQALALSLEPVAQDPGDDPNGDQAAVRFDAADEAIDGQRLFVGGLGADTLFEIPIEDTGQWAPAESSNQLELANAGGIKRIQVSPGVNAPVGNSDFSQFLYVVAGDGSTRVVGRELPAPTDSLGVECETQLDPTLVIDAEISACTPVSQVPIDPITQEPSDAQPAERRGLSRGPGIRPGRGNEFTDWMFRKVYEGEGGAGPSAEPGTVAVGVTTGGYVMYAMIDQERANGQTAVDTDIDPAGLLDVRLFAHSLWPEPIVGNSPFIAHPPLVLDDEPGRFIQSDSGPVRQLSPTLRRIDATYAEEDRASEQFGIDDLEEGDKFGEIYTNGPVRVAVHDYRGWLDSHGSNWTLEWGATIPNTRSTTGRLECDDGDDTTDDIGWLGGTCKVGSRLIDESANFCDDGVLRGDKLVLIGCNDDDGCGDGRRCLRETAAGGDSTGICISEKDYIERGAYLREVCSNFISDPCGEAYREFTITKATQNELTLQSMDQPLISRLATTPCEDLTNAVVVGDGCECLPGYSVAACDPGTVGECCQDSRWLEGQAPVLEVEDRYVCTEEQPDNGCSEDADCNEGVCIDSYCRRPCENDDECVFRRLPGPECFGEFVHYQIGLQDQFLIQGPGFEFFTQGVEIADDGSCQPTSNAALSQLLTSRLPLPPSDRPDEPDWMAIPTCDDDDVVSPSDPNPCRISAERVVANKFHNFRYENVEVVSALRYSNPVFSIVLDLTSLEGLTTEVLGYDDSVWPRDFVGFRRSRIPRGYRMSFGLQSGYTTFEAIMVLEGRPVTYPSRIIPGPQSNVAYVVDSSGPGSASSIRGQVVRLLLDEDTELDRGFIGVR